MSSSFARPTVLVSACLASIPCRWDGDRIRDAFVGRLKKRAQLISICPEVEIGLGVPREKIQLVRNGKSAVLYQPSSSRSFTRRMIGLAKEKAVVLPEIEGAIFKSKSPSCGPDGVKLFDSKRTDANFKREGVGIFAREWKQLRPDIPIVDEATLSESERRERFLTTIFTLANFKAATLRRQERIAPDLRHLEKFHEQHKFLLFVYGASKTAELSELLLDDKNADQTISSYRQLLSSLLGGKIRKRASIKMLESGLEHFRDDLNRSDVARFESLLTDYASGSQNLNELRALVRVWGVRYDRAWVRQPFWQPFPDGLL